MEEENDLVHQQKKVNKLLIATILIALVSCIMVFVRPSAAWFIALIISATYGLYESKVKKQEDDEF